ncbi:sensor domain-containing diguanylate cyclase [Thiomicrorhabdus lithotrophica]|uniref:Sensor domain-containing diguanylate cyclase n=1 Tax=Thiomicrorhabdus lithotrophica TaxID=2949997 RepID=A0ABY8C6R6_9GAMM|nr:sensor domain-containing diguanylate cyclase [Thiomicrorhabdus lithotrophica]WEJ61661.1 sensor domain-containing diguanylate cyclase [Thiomicrorhabdus lithotrophica]
MNLDILKQRAKAFDYLFDAVVVTDLHGVIIDWNKGSEDLYGYSKDEAIGQYVNILHVPEDSEKITLEVISTVEKFGKWSGEIRMLHKNGDIGWIESMCVPIYDSNEQMIGALGINRDITNRIKETERLEQLAHYDHLTKVPNRYLLLSRLEHLISQSERSKNQFALLFVDLDDFKVINDTKGHVFGDWVLIETASRLKQAIRDSDTVARIGGDEFVLVLENISNRNDVARMVQKITKMLNDDFMIENQKVEVSCSIGVAFYPEDGTTIDKLFTTADMNMYKAKGK